MRITSDPGIWIGAFATLAVFSILIKDNPAYRLVENIYVGSATGIAVVAAVDTIRSQALTPLSKGNMVLLIPILLGVILFTRYVNSVSYLARMPLALLTGAAAGVVLRGTIESQIVAQLTATMLNLGTLNGLVIFLGTVLSLSYFFLTWQAKGTAKLVPFWGRMFMMAAFGAAFGNTVMGRISTAIGRFQYLLVKFMGIGG